MQLLRLVCILVAITAGALCQIIIVKMMRPASLHAIAEVPAVSEAKADTEWPSSFALEAVADASSSGVSSSSEFSSNAGSSSQVSLSKQVSQSAPALVLAAASTSDLPASGVLSESAAAFGVVFDLPSSGALSFDMPSEPRSALPLQKMAALEEVKDEQEATDQTGSLGPSDDSPLRRKFHYLAYYVYSEIPPSERPADIVLNALKDIPVGTPIEEIRRASDAFGLDFNFMKAVAKIESDFDPKQRTGSYIGLFQLSHYEFARYGSGEITNPRDNAVAAAYKFVTEATQFEWQTHKQPTFSDLYLIHQQGWQGAAEHVAHPDQVAWKSMCDTDEGKEKGEKWCKRAIWQNTLPAIKQTWKSVDKLTSGAFVGMWRDRVDHLYARYSEATIDEQKR